MNFDYSDKTTLNLGNPNAEHELTIVLNLGCPFCRKFYLANRKAIKQNSEAGSLNIHIKFWNKPKPGLLNGNVANDDVDYSKPSEALEFIDKAYASQEIIDNLDHDDVAHYLEEELGASRHVSDEVAEDNIKEYEANGLTSVPTIIMDGKIVGDSNYKLADYSK